MRIDAYAQIQQVYGKKKTQKVQKETGTSFKDQLQISSVGRDIQVAKNAVCSVPDVREDLVASLKKTMNSGNYEVSSEEFAQKLMNKYYTTNMGSF